MVYILGVQLKEGLLAKQALTAFYGIGHKTAERICARFQIYERCKVRHLTPFQITELASFLSSTSTAPSLPRFPLAGPNFIPPPASTPVQDIKSRLGSVLDKVNLRDPLRNMKIEAELRREVRQNIAHQRQIGSYVGKRHAMGFPVRGQNTQTNARTAKKLNRIDRYG